jgi:hypothetical protein
MVPAYTFDNVKGQFPIGFKIWDTEIKEKFNNITVDVIDAGNTLIANKNFYSYSKNEFINKWINGKRFESKLNIGYMDGINGNDFQHNNIVYIINSKDILPNPRGIWINEKNLLDVSVYFTIRHTIEHTWINHNDQFLCPHNNYDTDTEFKHDCLINTVFAAKNAIQLQFGTNHWIPFTEQEVNAKEKFESNFMSKFIKDIELSKEAKDIIAAGLELWKYFHEKIQNKQTISVNASFYDIRVFFQGRNKNGNMNIASADEKYNKINKTLRNNLKLLGQRLEPKIYEYGFLK